MSRPNIVLMMSDQQRWDTLGCLGFEHAVTPNIDRLFERGLCFDRIVPQSAICAPARASMVSGQYVHAHGGHNNGTWAAEGTPNWIEDLRGAGYRTVNIGKMHTWPIRLECGFDYRWVAENKNHMREIMGGPDDYDLYLDELGEPRPANQYPNTVDDWFGQIGAAIWPLADEHWPDAVIGRKSVEQIQAHDFDQKPLFLWTGFVGPHDPYDVPASALERYGDRPIPEPICPPGELDTKPSAQKKSVEQMGTQFHQAAIHLHRATPEKMRRVRRHYYANCMIIDEWVGEIVKAIEAKGQLDNTIFLYTSDHGDCLGDHHQIYKFTTHYDLVARVHLVMAGPGVPKRGTVDALGELMDVGPTLLDLADVSSEGKFQAVSLGPVIRGEAEEVHDAVFSEYNVRRMVRTKDWKLVYYAGDREGEMYNLADDPDEVTNLFDDPEHKDKRAELMEQLLDWYARERYVR